MAYEIPKNSILFRQSPGARPCAPTFSITSLQSQVDCLVSHFVEEATSPTTLAAMVAGGMAYRVGRIGVMTLGVGARCNVPLWVASIAVGLGSEVTAFELTNRTLQTVGANLVFAPREGRSQGSPLPENLWSWSGPGGWREGLLNSLITFGMLKGAGSLAREQNLIFQHAFQSTAMVAGHHTAGLLGISHRPEGSLAEQFLHAEATNLQLGAGMGLVHSVAPGIFAIERGLDLSLRSIGRGLRADPEEGTQAEAPLQNRLNPFLPQWVTAGSPAGGRAGQRGKADALTDPNIYMMSAPREERRNSSPPTDRPPPTLAFFLQRHSLVPLLQPIFEGLPSHRRCLLLEVPFSDLKGVGQVREMLRDHQHLREIWIHFPDGRVTWFLKNGERVDSESEEPGFVRMVARESVYAPREVQTIKLYSSWKVPKEVQVLAPLLSGLRQSSRLSQREVSNRLREEGVELQPNTLSQYETGSARGPSFEVLRSLAGIYQVDMRDLIESANRSRFPDLSPRLWKTTHYPIFIEDIVDVRRLQFYEETDPDQKTVGWLLFAARKNPFQYLIRPEVVHRTGLSRSPYDSVEDNVGRLSPTSLMALSRVLRIPERDLIRANNYTFHRDLIPRLEQLFPGRTIFIDPHEDPGRLDLYERAPHSIGKILFEFRKGLPGLPTAAQLSEHLGLHPDYWFLRETNTVPVRANNLSEWTHLFQKAGMPLSRLDPFVKSVAVEKESPRYLISRAMEGRSTPEVSRESGLSEKTILDLLNFSDSPRQIEPETLWILKRALPTLDGARLLRRLRPETLRFFPELGGDDPSIEISLKQIEAALTLNVGERLYALRMDRSLEKSQIARRLGVTPRVVDLYESQVSQPRDDVTLFHLAQVLDLDPKVVYLHYHPEVLGLAHLRNAKGDPLEGIDVADLKRRRIVRDAHTLREKIGSFAKSRGIEKSEDLAKHLGLSAPAPIKRLVFLHDNLTLSNIEFLKGFFPELPVRSFFEHYHFSALSYFLGKKEEGTINYEIPGGLSWRWLERLNLPNLIREAVGEKGHSLRDAVALGLTELGSLPLFQKKLNEGRIKDETLARISRILGIDRRLLYFYVHRRELKQVLEDPQ